MPCFCPALRQSCLQGQVARQSGAKRTVMMSNVAPHLLNLPASSQHRPDTRHKALHQTSTTHTWHRQRQQVNWSATLHAAPYSQRMFSKTTISINNPTSRSYPDTALMCMCASYHRPPPSANALRWAVSSNHDSTASLGCLRTLPGSTQAMHPKLHLELPQHPMSGARNAASHILARLTPASQGLDSQHQPREPPPYGHLM